MQYLEPNDKISVRTPNRENRYPKQQQQLRKQQGSRLVIVTIVLTVLVTSHRSNSYYCTTLGSRHRIFGSSFRKEKISCIADKGFSKSDCAMSTTTGSNNIVAVEREITHDGTDVNNLNKIKLGSTPISVVEVNGNSNNCHPIPGNVDSSQIVLQQTSLLSSTAATTTATTERATATSSTILSADLRDDVLADLEIGTEIAYQDRSESNVGQRQQQRLQDHLDNHSDAIVLHHYSPLLPLPDSADPDDLWTALIVLNAPIASPPSPLFQRLWSKSAYRVCADGGANRLYQATSRMQEVEQYIPDLITGDLDSLMKLVEEEYASRGVPVVRVYDQDSNDLDKAIHAVIREFNAILTQQRPLSRFHDVRTSNGKVHDTVDGEDLSDNNVDEYDARGFVAKKHLRIIVYGAFGGRFDQEMASMQALYAWKNTDLILYNDHTMSFLLDGGLNVVHKIHLALPPPQGAVSNIGITTTTVDGGDASSSTATTDQNQHQHHVGEGVTCGLIPLGGPVDSVTTTGLQWNLNDTPTAFGELVSTSNRIIAPDNIVTVVTSHPIVFTAEMHSGLETNVWL